VSHSSDDDELGAGGIVGISVGALFVAVCAVISILALTWYLYHRKQQRYVN